MALYTCKKCGKQVPVQYAVCPFCQTPRPAPEEYAPASKKKKKHRILGPVLAVIGVMIVLGAIFGNSSEKEDSSKDDKQAGKSVIEQDVSSTSIDVDTSEPDKSDTSNKPGPCTLPSGFEITLFYNTVRNDVTGNWRLAAGSSSIPVADCAFEYYNTMFLSDDEIHAVWNASLGTTTCIKAMSGLLFVDTYEYVDGEEHDAKLLFSGLLLDSQILDLKTGEPFDDLDSAPE